MGPDREFAEFRPVANLGYSAAAITPGPDLIAEIRGERDDQLDPAIGDLSRPTTMKARLLIHQFLRQDLDCGADTLSADELIVAAIEEAMMRGPRPSRASTAAVVNRAKELLHACAGERLSLSDVARQVDVSPVYLTQTFTQAEGMPLYRYQLKLRLSRALQALPKCDDIRGLALDLGFSSPSHFGSSFKAAFGMPPSGFRKLVSS